jgi:primary-amine oxidase
MLRPVLLTILITCAAGIAQNTSQSPAHPLDGLTAAEYKRVKAILGSAEKLIDATRFHSVSLEEPEKSEVRAWKSGTAFPRRALAVVGAQGTTYEALVDLNAGTLVSYKPVSGEPAVLLEEVTGATDIAIADPRMVAGLAKRGLKPQQVYCLPLTAGAFGSPEEAGKRLMKVPCYVKPSGSNYFAKPIEGLFATIDLKSKTVIDVTDTGIAPVPQKDWGYTAAEIASYRGSRGTSVSPARLSQTGAGNIAIEGSRIQWDIWRFHLRVDKRPGVVLSLLDVRDGERWRSVAYQMNLSEVFVPYMDPDKGWYFRTYMDSGEYGFGNFLSPLKKGTDCPANAKFISMTLSDDRGDPMALPDSVCVFERSIGDPVWRHFEIFAQSPGKIVPAEGRPATELVVRSASEVGNYDYLIDYIFQQDGTIRIAVGATGIDSVKGVAAKSMKDPTAADDTRYGTLIAPNLVAPMHSHFFNFRLDLDIDGESNDFMRVKLTPQRTSGSAPRKSYWSLDHEMPPTEKEARTRIDPASPAALHFVNRNVESALGHHPGYMLDPSGSYANSLLTPDDPPFQRNAYIAYQLWVTPFSPGERYAGGRYPMMSDGSDTLATWSAKDRSIGNRDIVAWYTMGFHHIPRMEDWPVMPTHWSSFSLMPFNFFANNPALTVPNGR